MPSIAHDILMTPGAVSWRREIRRPVTFQPVNLMLRIVVLAAFGTLLLPAVAERAEAASPPPTEKHVYKEVDGRKLEIWMWKPAGWKSSDRRSAIVFFHGGGWRGGNPSAFSRQSAKLAERGMVAFSVQYRLTSQPDISIADCVKDAKSAFRWVRANAARLGINPATIAAGGGSAGGHLATALWALDGINDRADDTRVSTRPVALVLLNPALQFDASPKVREVVAHGRASKLNLAPYDHLKPGHPPTLILHGTDDTTVPMQSVRDYAAKVRELGGDCTVVEFQGEAHGFFNKEPQV
jgi:acetyl esterase/lipase